MDHPAHPASALPATASVTGARTTSGRITSTSARAAAAAAPPGTPPGAVRSGAAPRSLGGDLGMATAEYAIATLAACGFAGLLVAVLSSDEVRGMLMGIIQRALSTV